MEKIAVIRFDANIIKLTIAEVNNNADFVICDELTEAIKIGQDLERDGLILKSKISDAIQILKNFNRVIASNNCTYVVPVITNTLQEAKNLKSFIEEIRSSTALNFKVLEQKDEVENVYVSVVNTVDIPKGVIINITAESTQFIMYNRKQILQVEELPFGDFLLAKMFENDDSEPSVINEKMLEFVTNQMNKIEWFGTLEEDVQFIGVGEAFLTLAKLARKIKKYPIEIEHNYIFTKSDYENTNKILKDLGKDKTRKIKGISETRIDVLTSGLNIVGAIFGKLNLEFVTLSKSDYVNGVFFNYCQNKKETTSSVDVLGQSLNTINEFLDNNDRNNEVYELAIILYRQLKVLHKLPRQFAKVLRIAVYMNKIGEKLNYLLKDKTAFNFILNSNICGANHREIVLAAFVVASQELDNFNVSEWVRYKDILEDQDLEAVKKLAIILRLACCFDRTKMGVVKDINCDTLGDSVILKTVVEGDASLEIREAIKVQSDFKKAFNYNLEVL